jgi:DNA-binding transcriptional regulator LsrR (DeoR family)
VVQLLGGVGHKGAFEATLLTQRLATLLNCPAFLLPSQSIEQSVQSKQRIVQMEEVKEVLQRFDSITLAIVGIGDLEPSQLLRNSGNYYTEDMLRLLAERGAVGDICLRYFDAQGKPVLEEDEEFVVSVALPKLRAIHRVLGLAGGLNKVQAIRGALTGGYLDILITDLDTAQALNQ